MRLGAIVALCAIMWGMLMTGGCSEQTRYNVLSFFFEGAPKPGEERGWELAGAGHPRRVPLFVATPKPTPKPVEVKEEFPFGWLPALIKTIPQDNGGYADMVAAFNKGLIKPRPGLKGATEKPLSEDVVELIPEGKLALSFPHKPHTVWLGCYSCHRSPKLFKMKAGGDKMSMDEMGDGKFCGFCHGTVAFPLKGECGRCHPKFKKGKPQKVAKTVAGDIVFKRSGANVASQDISPATFPHLAHRVVFRCYACHDSLFPMQHEPKPVTMAQMKDGKQCGACHNGRVAFGVTMDTCARCHR